jgi:L-lactate dehydrogenase complex protein LldG
MNGRDAILARVRQGLRRNGRPATDRTAVETRIAAHARGPLPVFSADLAARFREKATSLASTVDGPVPAAEAPAAIARYLEEQKLARRAVCWPALAGMVWAAAGMEVEARAARADDLTGITGGFCGIAETGTLMLLSGPQTPPTVSLLPETHIALLPVARLVAHMEDGWDLLRREHGKMPRAVNFVSGPSRTADIEQTVTLGAHGPYRVHIVLVA